MKCPHCLESFHEVAAHQDLPNTQSHDNQMRPKALDADGYWSLAVTLCPACNRNTIFLRLTGFRRGNKHVAPQPYSIMVWPRGMSRSPLPTEVPEEFADEYREACLVLADSPKASAALSRRCLQHLIHEKAGIKRRDLSQEIDELMPTLPPDLSDSIDAVRNLGNFSAHPTKSKSTGEIVDVEPGEAEWTLDVLEGLFDHYFVRPAKLAAKKDALNAKLQDAGKPPMK